MLLGLGLAASVAQAPASAQGRLNTTGRTIAMPVPLKDGDRALGEVVVRIMPDDAVMVTKASLVERIAPALTKDEASRLQSLPDENGLVRIEAVAAAGFALAFDTARLELAFSPAVDQRETGEIAIRPRTHRELSNPPVEALRPAAVSAYVNVAAGIDHAWDVSTSARPHDALRLDFEAVARFWNVVVETELAYEQGSDGERDALGRPLYLFAAEGLRRRGTRLVYDVPSERLRFQAGDARVEAAAFQHAGDILGVALERSPHKLAPGDAIRPMGRGSFRIERTADVDVLVNGTLLRRLRLRPGNYNLSDLPLQAGANDIELVITDEAGETRRLSFSAFSGERLLVPGQSVWALSAGVPSYLEAGSIAYRDSDWLASGFYRAGLTGDLTGELHAQGDALVQMSGAGAYLRTPVGFLALRGAASRHLELGWGYAAGLDWEIVKAAGLLGEGQALRIAAEFRSTQFATPGLHVDVDELTTRDPRFALYNSYRWRVEGSYAQALGAGLTATLSARYQASADDLPDPRLAAYQIKGDRFGVDLTLSAPIAGDASVSVTIGYSNEAFQALDGISRSPDPDVRAGIRLFWRTDDATRLTAGYDVQEERSSASAQRTFGRGVGRWETTVEAQHEAREGRAVASGSVTYYGNRAEVQARHVGGFGDLGAVSAADQRSSLRLATSLAYADGHVAFGPPIRGTAFAILAPHESLKGRDVLLGRREDVVARSDGLGPGVVTQLPAYVRTLLPVDVLDLPLGYSLGSGAFDIEPPYRAGYALHVGSGYSVSAYGTLIGADGQPVALLAGIARPEGGPGRAVEVFTNQAGRFAAEGLAPGRWVLEIEGDNGMERFVLDIPAGTHGLFKAGELRADGGRG